MQAVLVCRHKSLDASCWPHSKHWDVFPRVPHAALVARGHGRALARILSTCRPAARYFCSLLHPHLTWVLVSWSVRQAFAPRHDTACGNDELYAVIWIWHRCASGCCDRCGTAWCPALARQQSPALANACGRSTGAYRWHAPLSWILAECAIVVPGCLTQQTFCSQIADLGEGGNPELTHSRSNPFLAPGSQAKAGLSEGLFATHAKWYIAMQRADGCLSMLCWYPFFFFSLTLRQFYHSLSCFLCLTYISYGYIYSLYIAISEICSSSAGSKGHVFYEWHIPLLRAVDQQVIEQIHIHNTHIGNL